MKYGTGASAAAMGLDFPAAGKTGTTEDYHDAYFIGYTPRAGMRRVGGIRSAAEHRPASGAQAALPAWVNFMVECRAAHVGDLRGADGNHDGDDRSGKRRARDDRMPAHCRPFRS